VAVTVEEFEPGRAAVPAERTVRQPAKGDFHPTSELPEVDTGTGWPDAEESNDADGDRPRRPVRDDDEPVRRWRGPSGCLAWLVGLVVIVVVLGLGLNAVGWLPHFHNPFASKTTDRSQPPLLLSIQDLARFEAASGNFQEVIDVQKERSHIPDVLFSDRTLFVCVGSVDVYVDFSRLAQGDLTDSPDHKSVTIKLPAPQFEKPNIDHGKSYVFATQQGVLNKIGDLFANDPNKQQELYVLGEQRIAQAARDSGLADRAATNTKQMLTGMLKGLGYVTININVASS
jgi:uncharacterized protein DUF4230